MSFTEKDAKKWREFVCGALLSTGIRPEYSKEENDKIFIAYLKNQTTTRMKR